MNDSTAQEKKTRDWFKCSACRQRKKKCDPQPRDWEVSKQKCQYCQAHGLSCGPNYRNNEDPAVIRPVSENPVTQEEGSSRRRSQASLQRPGPSALQSPAGQSNTSFSALDNFQRQNPLSFNVGLTEDRRDRIGALSDEALGEVALSRLSEFHALGTSLFFASHTTHRQAHGPSQPYDHLSVDQELHSLFIYIYKIGVEADSRGQCDRARWILLALLNALEKYPGLVDGRKGHVLLKTALILQRLGHRWESEHLFVKVASMYEFSALVPHEDPRYLVASSFSDSSELIKSTLAKLWQETIGGDHLSANLTVPPLHRAVQDRNPGIIMAILSDPSGVSSHPPAVSQQSLQDTASSIIPSVSNTIAQVGANTEGRDLRDRTALFLAVANGDEQCCYALICHGADVNTRDAHGHTALEIAAREGHLNIVKRLTESGATVNPDMACCSSSPLQAAIESDNFNLDLVGHLLNLGAWVDLQRYDKKSAIDLADERRLTQLAASMREMISDSQHQHPFMIGDPDINT